MSGPTIERMHRRRHIDLLAVATAVGFALAACSPASSGAPTGLIGGASNPAPASAATSAATASPIIVVIPPKSDTPWGRIWTGVPPSFPLPAGASPAEAGSEPASGAFDVPASSGTARQVADFYRTAFENASPPYDATIDGPLEDGALVVEVKGRANSAACSIQVRVAPLGVLTRLTILYGAGCDY
jgi:hypothetical protein